MEALLLFVQQLKAEGLHAAGDPPLVADQLHPYTPHISRAERGGRETHAHALGLTCGYFLFGGVSSAAPSVICRRE